MSGRRGWGGGRTHTGPEILTAKPSELCEAPTSGYNEDRSHVRTRPCEGAVPVTVIFITKYIIQGRGEVGLAQLAAYMAGMHHTLGSIPRTA